MARYDKYDLKQEIDFIYITNDGKRFVYLDQAIKHQRIITRKYVAPWFKTSPTLTYLISYIHHLVLRSHI